MAGHILIAATSATKLLDGRETGCWVEEVAVPYFLWREKGFQVGAGGRGLPGWLVLAAAVEAPPPCATAAAARGASCGPCCP